MEPSPEGPQELHDREALRSEGRGSGSRRRRLLLIVVVVALLYPLYLGLANFFLSSPLGPWALNLRPKRLTIHWSRAWSLYPGNIHVRGLKVRGDASRAKWSFDVDQGQGWIDVPALLGRKFRLVDFEGSGVRSVTLRKPAQPRPPGQKPSRRRGWRLAFERVRLHHVREIVLDKAHLVGDTEVRGTFSSQIGAKLQLERTEVRSRGARFLGGPTTLARDLDLAAVLEISPYAPREHSGVEGFDFISGTLDAHGITSGAPGGGRLTVRLKLDHGRAQPGTDLRWSTSQLAASPPPPATPAASAPMAKTGAPGATVPPTAAPPGPSVGFLRLEVQPGTPPLLQLKAELDDLAIGGRDGRPPVFAARGLTLQSSTLETRLSALLTSVRHPRQARQGEAASADAWLADVGAGPVDLGTIGLRRTWSLHLDRAAGRISLSALIRRGITISGLRAEGVTGRLEIVDRPGPLPQGPARPWALHFTDAEVRGLRDLSFNAFTLRGVTAMAGGFTRDREGEVEVAGARAEMEHGEILQQGKPLALDLSLHAALDLPAIRPADHPGLEMLDGADATLAGTGKAVGGGRRGQATARRGAAPDAMNVDLRLVKGVLADDSQLALTLPSLPTSDFASFGKPLFVAATVTQGRLDVSAEARELTLGARPDRPPLLVAKRATFSTSTPERRLAKLFPRGPQGQAKGAGLVPAGLLGDIAGEELTIGGISTQGRWSASAERGGARLDLSALGQKRLRLAEVTATGVVMRLDPFPSGASRPASPPSAWSLDVSGLRLTQIRSLAVGSDRIVGPAEASGHLTFDPRRRLALRDFRIDIPAGTVEAGREAVGRNLTLQAALTLVPLQGGDGSQEHGLAFLRRLSGTVKGHSQIASLGFLKRYLKASWLDVKGRGDLDADIRLAEGRLLVGTKVSLERGQLQTTVFDGIAQGNARLVATVEGKERPTARIRAAFEQFVVLGTNSATPFMRGKGLTLDLSSNDLDLATPVSDLKASVDLPLAAVPDLRAFNVYLPEGAGAEIQGGTGGIDLHLDLDGAANTARGKVRINSSDAKVRFQELELGGRVKLEALLASKDLKGREFALNGTRLDLDQVAYGETDGPKDSKAPPWWAHLKLSDGSMTWGRPLALRSRFEVQMKDSALILDIVAQRKSFLHWFANVLTVEDVTARGEIAFQNGAIEVDPLRVEGGKLDLRSRFRFSREHKNADLFLNYGKFSTGIALRDGKRDFKILKPEVWFEKREGWEKK